MWVAFCKGIDKPGKGHGATSRRRLLVNEKFLNFGYTPEAEPFRDTERPSAAAIGFWNCKKCQVTDDKPSQELAKDRSEMKIALLLSRKNEKAVSTFLE